MKIRYTALAAAGMLLTLTACGGTDLDTTEGWHCNAYQHQTYSSARLTDDAALSAAMDPLKEASLSLSDSYDLTGFFTQSVSLSAEKSSSVSQPGLSGKAYADAAYNDCWYFVLNDPSQYLSLPADLMPQMVRITYAPKGCLSSDDRESVIISFNYLDTSDNTTDAVVFTWYNGPQTAAAE